MTTHTKPTTSRRAIQFDVAKPRIETRAAGDGQPDQQVIVGYGAVFYRESDQAGTQYPLWSDTFERVMPGAFDVALQEDVVRGTYDHRDLLGRSDSGTLRLSVDKIGLRYEIDVPDTQAGRDAVTLLERGDLDGSSFGFSVYGKRGVVKWVTETRDGKQYEIRELHEVELIDVGPVVWPAYPGATAGLRSEDDLQEARADYERHQADQRAAELDTQGLELSLATTIAAAEQLLG